MIINKYNLNLIERRFFMSTTNILDLNNRIDEFTESYPANNVMLNNGDSVQDGTTLYIGDTLLTTINTYNASWEATANGWCVGYMGATSDHLAIVSLDGATIVSSGGTSYAANMVYPVCFPIKKGQTLTTRNDSATIYNIKVLAMG